MANVPCCVSEGLAREKKRIKNQARQARVYERKIDARQIAEQILRSATITTRVKGLAGDKGCSRITTFSNAAVDRSTDKRR